MIFKIKKITKGIKFLLMVIVSFAIVYFFQPEIAKDAFNNFLLNFYKVLPILVLVFFVMFLSYVFVKPEAVKRHLGHDSGLKGWIYAILGSTIISGPPYVIFPLLGELRDHGMKYSLITVFMNNRNVQPIFIPVIAYYFGWKLSVVLAVYVLIFAIFSGIIMGKIMQEKNNI